MNDSRGPWPVFQPAGDSALLITLGVSIDEAVNRQVHALARALAADPIAGQGEVVPGYAALLVHYDPLVVDYETMERWTRQHLSARDAPPAPSRLVEIRVVYGGESGPDLAFVAEHNGLRKEEVIAIHSSAEYSVFMMGFSPGFPYLGGMDRAIATPRLSTPRSRVPAGSVGIAGEQTGIYPVESPGGWRIIGRTALRLFDPHGSQPFLLAPGDRVRFVPVQPGEE